MPHDGIAVLRRFPCVRMVVSKLHNFNDLNKAGTKEFVVCCLQVSAKYTSKQHNPRMQKQNAIFNTTLRRSLAKINEVLYLFFPFYHLFACGKKTTNSSTLPAFPSQNKMRHPRVAIANVARATLNPSAPPTVKPPAPAKRLINGQGKWTEER